MLLGERADCLSRHYSYLAPLFLVAMAIFGGILFSAHADFLLNLLKRLTISIDGHVSPLNLFSYHIFYHEIVELFYGLGIFDELLVGPWIFFADLHSKTIF